LKLLDRVVSPWRFSGLPASAQAGSGAPARPADRARRQQVSPRLAAPAQGDHRPRTTTGRGPLATFACSGPAADIDRSARCGQDTHGFGVGRQCPRRVQCGRQVRRSRGPSAGSMPWVESGGYQPRPTSRGVGIRATGPVIGIAVSARPTRRGRGRCVACWSVVRRARSGSRP
jgi:hypothetical protein